MRPSTQAIPRAPRAGTSQSSTTVSKGPAANARSSTPSTWARSSDCAGATSASTAGSPGSAGGRSCVGHAAGWSEILARGLIVWSTLLVAAAGFRLGAMIPIDFLRGLLPGPAQIWVIRLVTLLTLAFLAVLVWQGWSMTLRVQAQRVAMLGTSMSWFYAAIPLGALMAIPGVLLRHVEQERERP